MSALTDILANCASAPGGEQTVVLGRNQSNNLGELAEAEVPGDLTHSDSEHECLPDEPENARSRNPGRDALPSLAKRFLSRLKPFSNDEIRDARQPHPHAFEEGDCGLLPIGEVSVIAAPGREGKTFASVTLAVAYVLGIDVVGLTPQSDRAVIIYSAEDDRKQYARKVAAHVSQLDQQDAARVHERLLVPDLSAPGMEPFCTLVQLSGGRPSESQAIDAVIAALRPAMKGDRKPGLLIFETASTLSEADEDNLSFKTIVSGLRRIARELRVAVVLVHHTSQQAALNLPELNISAADIRGGTALAFNARQCFLLVNLGSDEDPLQHQDARTVLRKMVAPEDPGRVTALICLDSSKGSDPPPVFFRWSSTPYGPALNIIAAPPPIQGVRWKKVRQIVHEERAERRLEAKEAAQQRYVRQVIEIATRLVREGRYPTVRAVSMAAGRSATWAKPYLYSAVGLGQLVVKKEKVPRTDGQTDVYRPTHSTGATI